MARQLTVRFLVALLFVAIAVEVSAAEPATTTTTVAPPLPRCDALFSSSLWNRTVSYSFDDPHTTLEWGRYLSSKNRRRTEPLGSSSSSAATTSRFGWFHFLTTGEWIMELSASTSPSNKGHPLRQPVSQSCVLQVAKSASTGLSPPEDQKSSSLLLMYGPSQPEDCSPSSTVARIPKGSRSAPPPGSEEDRESDDLLRRTIRETVSTPPPPRVASYSSHGKDAEEEDSPIIVRNTKGTTNDVSKSDEEDGGVLLQELLRVLGVFAQTVWSVFQSFASVAWRMSSFLFELLQLDRQLEAWAVAIPRMVVRPRSYFLSLFLEHHFVLQVDVPVTSSPAASGGRPQSIAYQGWNNELVRAARASLQVVSFPAVWNGHAFACNESMSLPAAEPSFPTLLVHQQDEDETPTSSLQLHRQCLFSVVDGASVVPNSQRHSVLGSLSPSLLRRIVHSVSRWPAAPRSETSVQMRYAPQPHSNTATSGEPNDGDNDIAEEEEPVLMLRATCELIKEMADPVCYRITSSSSSPSRGKRSISGGIGGGERDEVVVSWTSTYRTDSAWVLLLLLTCLCAITRPLAYRFRTVRFLLCVVMGLLVVSIALFYFLFKDLHNTRIGKVGLLALLGGGIAVAAEGIVSALTFFVWTELQQNVVMQCVLAFSGVASAFISQWMLGDVLLQLVSATLLSAQILSFASAMMLHLEPTLVLLAGYLNVRYCRRLWTNVLLFVLVRIVWGVPAWLLGKLFGVSSSRRTDVRESSEVRDRSGSRSDRSEESDDDDDDDGEPKDEFPPSVYEEAPNPRRGRVGGGGAPSSSSLMKQYEAEGSQHTRVALAQLAATIRQNPSKYAALVQDPNGLARFAGVE